ncbi:sigma-70 family RNA polymerase sigma factor [Stakelama sp. CBK3Z-3]|uniref:Sigma-70 family RNA polymerase sigma factor n=1 Tax=Stakelama flava TaxID=2860338 RepID=A0ABS6XJQ7_9SPHN|nr:sigma-70 family RNA polymerase sigma factor [Stakelama flava]MBW4330438.1 sigma-70 family RNA polymerase sigma factor [Stakelama flava]
MSKITAALEVAVAEVIANLPKDGEKQTNRQRVASDRAFARVLDLVAPRIRHFIRQYGLIAHWDDAEQCCAIGVHRAIQAYDPSKAQFTTFVNWQLRGELQSLRFRVMTDQRPSAKKVDATTVSLHATATGDDGETTSLESMVEDEDALERTEAAAAEHLADNTREALLDAYVEHLREVGLDQLRRRARNQRSRQNDDSSLPRFRAKGGIDADELAELEERLASQREIVAHRLNDDLSDMTDDPQERERLRQVAKRAAKTIAKIAETDERFGGMFERRKPQPRRRDTDRIETRQSLLPDAVNSQGTRVMVVEATDMEGARVALPMADAFPAARSRLN